MRLSRKAALPLIVAPSALIPSILLLRPDHPILGMSADAVTGLAVGFATGLAVMGLIALNRGRRCAG